MSLPSGPGLHPNGMTRKAVPCVMSTRAFPGFGLHPGQYSMKGAGPSNHPPPSVPRSRALRFADAGVKIIHRAVAFSRGEPIGTGYLAGDFDLLAPAQKRSEPGPRLGLAKGLGLPLDQAGGLKRRDNRRNCFRMRIGRWHRWIGGRRVPTWGGM